MRTRKRDASQWLLWLLLPAFAAAALLESRLQVSAGWHRAIEACGVLLVYGLLWVWLHVHRIAWLREPEDRKERHRNA